MGVGSNSLLLGHCGVNVVSRSFSTGNIYDYLVFSDLGEFKLTDSRGNIGINYLSVGTLNANALATGYYVDLSGITAVILGSLNYLGERIIKKVAEKNEIVDKKRHIGVVDIECEDYLTVAVAVHTREYDGVASIGVKSGEVGIKTALHILSDTDIAANHTFGKLAHGAGGRGGEGDKVTALLEHYLALHAKATALYVGVNAEKPYGAVGGQALGSITVEDVERIAANGLIGCS